MIDAANNSTHRPGVREEVLTVEQAAAELGVLPGVVYAAVRRGQIPHVRIGRIIRIPRGRFEAFKRAELDEDLLPRVPQNLPQPQKDLLKGAKSIIVRR